MHSSTSHLSAATPNSAGTFHMHRCWADQSIVEALMVALGMIVGQELGSRFLQGVLTQQDEALETGFFLILRVNSGSPPADTQLLAMLLIHPPSDSYQ